MASTSKELAQGFYDALIALPNSREAIINGFANAIISAGLASRVERISDEFIHIAEIAEGETFIKGTSAHDIEVGDARIETDKSLIAGAILSKGEYVVDASIKSRLSAIKNTVNA